MSDTPRTDAVMVVGSEVAGYEAIVPADFARTLERELNEAKENAKKIFCPWCQSTYEKGDDPYKSVLEHLNTCLKHPIAERDQLRKENEELKSYNQQLKEGLSASDAAFFDCKQKLLATELALVKKDEALKEIAEGMPRGLHLTQSAAQSERAQEALTITPTTALQPIREALESGQTMIVVWQCVRDQILTDTTSSRYFDKAKAQIKHALSLLPAEKSCPKPGEGV